MGSNLVSDPRRWPSLKREEEELRLWAMVVNYAAEKEENET